MFFGKIIFGLEPNYTRSKRSFVVITRPALTLRSVFDILTVRIFADISISVGIYEYLFSERKGFS